jgi:hypothetical protein
MFSSARVALVYKSSRLQYRENGAVLKEVLSEISKQKTRNVYKTSLSIPSPTSSLIYDENKLDLFAERMKMNLNIVI